MIGGDTRLFHATIEQFRDAVNATLDPRGIDIVEQNVVARLRAHLRDAGPHLTGTNDENLHRTVLADANQNGVALTTTAANCRDAVAAATPAQLIDDGADNTCARCADWMAHCDRAALHVDDVST
jgi:hypothetical protein